MNNSHPGLPVGHVALLVGYPHIKFFVAIVLLTLAALICHILREVHRTSAFKDLQPA